jgi:hypothetical protein
VAGGSPGGGVFFGRRDGLGGGREAVGEQAGDAAVAQVVEMQAIARDDVIHPVLAARDPVLHNGEPSEHLHLRVVSRHTDRVDHPRARGPCEDPRRELRIHQHDVQARPLEPPDPFVDRGGVALDVPRPEGGEAAGLPDDELGPVGQHVALEAPEHRGDRLASDPLLITVTERRGHRRRSSSARTAG